MNEAEGNAAMQRVLADMVTAVVGDDLGSQHVTAVYTMAAIAGQIAQLYALRARAEAGLPPTGDDLAVITTANGRHYYFGDLISGALLGTADDPGAMVFLAGLDARPLDQDRVGAFFSRAAATVGSSDYGVPQVNFTLLATIDEAVQRFDAVLPVLRGNGVPMSLWPRFSGLAAREAILLAEAGTAPFDYPSGMDRGRMIDLAIDAAVCGSHVDLDDFKA
jgi:hypothetical protein